MLAGSAGQSAMRVLFTMVLARLLTPEDFGLIATATIVTSFAELFVQFGFGQSLVQKKKISPQDVGTAYTCSLALGVAFGLSTLALAEPLAHFFEQPALAPVLRMLALLFPIKSLNQIQYGILQREMKFKALAGRDALSYLIGYGMAGIGLAILGYGVYALVWAILLQAVVYSILLSVSQQSYKIRFSYSSQSFNALFSFGKNLTLAKIFNYAATRGDYFIISKMLGAAPLGYYSRGYSLMNIPNNLAGRSVDTVLFSDFSKNQENRSKVATTLGKAYLMILRVTLPALPWFFFYAEEIVLLLLGEQWRPVIAIFQVLIVGMSFRLLYKISSSLVRGLGYMVFNRWAQFAYMLVVLAGSYVGSFIGLQMIAWTINLAIFLNFMVLTHKVVLETDYRWAMLGRAFVSVVPVTLLVAGICWLCTWGFGELHIQGFAEFIFSAGLIAIALYLCDRFLPAIAFAGQLTKALQLGQIKQLMK